jgi:hypothetical protein
MEASARLLGSRGWGSSSPKAYSLRESLFLYALSLFGYTGVAFGSMGMRIESNNASPPGTCESKFGRVLGKG